MSVKKTALALLQAAAGALAASSGSARPCAGDGMIAMSDPYLQVVGRVDRSDPASIPLHWSGSMVRANFSGTSLALRMGSTPSLIGKPDPLWSQYLWVIIDGKDQAPVQVKLEPQERVYPIAQGLPDSTHSLLIIKKTEAVTGDSILKGILLDKGHCLTAPPKPRLRRIQFIGDSLTCAYGVDCEGRPCEKDSINENAYHSWARILADRFDADAHIIAQTGIGLRLGYTQRLLPDIVNTMRLEDAGQTWDSQAWQPDLLVFCFLGNDADFGPNAANTLPQYVQSYVALIQDQRKRNPKALILCTMGSWAVDPKLPWVGIYNAAVREMNTVHGDKGVFAMPVGIHYNGIKTHPKAKDQAAIASEVGDFIHSQLPLGW